MRDMNECDPNGNKITIHGVEICLLDLHFSSNVEADLERTWAAIKEKNPDADLKECADQIRKALVKWANRRKNERTSHPTP